jgi:hypothetical protein
LERVKSVGSVRSLVDARRASSQRRALAMSIRVIAEVLAWSDDQVDRIIRRLGGSLGCEEGRYPAAERIEQREISLDFGILRFLLVWHIGFQ